MREPATPAIDLCPHRLPVRPAEPFSSDQCRVCWVKARRAAGLPWQAVVHGPPVPVTIRPQRPTDCIYLGAKLDQTSSCRGLCWHTCDAGLGATGKCRPGIECQACPPATPGTLGYEADQ